MRRPLRTALLVVASAGWAIACTFTRPVAPEQPIEFSHRDHVRGADQLDCALCHSGARRSAFAGIAPVERCMGCHRYVLTGNPDITKLRRAWDAGKTIEWVKVYALPQFVRFNHGAHAVAGISCEACHGDVGAMNRIVRATDLTMGWCLTCHRDRGASIDCIACHY